eukprot:m.187603 g.187603  ORF g.187603 m.187603 type:complete len:91 (-) comp53579_c0_seq5:2087-2359(-)
MFVLVFFSGSFFYFLASFFFFARLFRVIAVLVALRVLCPLCILRAEAPQPVFFNTTTHSTRIDLFRSHHEGIATHPLHADNKQRSGGNCC